MKSLNLRINRNNLHHAYCILGDSTDVINELKAFFLKELDFPIVDNPDFWYGKFDVMDIEDGREIKNSHQNRPIKGDKKIFVVSANFITEKAQNAMLKLFEEPRGDTHFFLILPSLSNIIPTFRSRFFVIDANESNDSIINPKEFLQMSLGKRMDSVKKICENVSHEKSRDLVASDDEKSKIEIIKFINALEATLHADSRGLNVEQRGKMTQKDSDMFESIEMIRQYAGEQSPSLKMLLEHLALLLPLTK